MLRTRNYYGRTDGQSGDYMLSSWGFGAHNKGHLLVMIKLPTKFEEGRLQLSVVINRKQFSPFDL